MTPTARPTYFAMLEQSEQADKLGFTLRQWQRMPAYLRDEFLSQQRKIEALTRDNVRLAKGHEPTRIWQGWGASRDRTVRFMPEEEIHFGDSPRSCLFNIRWDGDEQVLHLFGQSGIVIAPAADNHFTVTLKDY